MGTIFDNWDAFFDALPPAVLPTPREAHTPAFDLARLPVRSIDERVQRVHETYAFSLLEHTEVWDSYIAIENGVDKHELIAILTETGWLAVACDCQAFQVYDENCVHCVALNAHIKETEMGNGQLEMVRALPQALAERRERGAEFYAVVNDTYFKGKGTPALLDFVSVFCERLELDIFANHVCVIERRSKDKDTGKWLSAWQVMVTIYGYLALADKTDEYEGVTEMEWCGPDGAWVDVWLSDEYPSAARATVHRKGRKPFTAVVKWESFVQTVKDYNSGQERVNETWNKMPAEQLMKCALKLGLTRQFPNNTMFRRDDKSTPLTAPAMVDEETGEVLDGQERVYGGEERTVAADEPIDAEYHHDGPTDIDFAIADAKQRVTIAANVSHRKQYWFDEVKRRNYSTAANLNALADEIEADKPAPTPPGDHRKEQAAEVKAKVEKAKAQAPSQADAQPSLMAADVTNGMTDEEKANIEALELAEAQAEADRARMEGDGDVEANPFGDQEAVIRTAGVR